MFIGFSKVLSKGSKFRIGAGIRLTKKNAPWLAIVLMFYWALKMMIFIMVLYAWLTYAVCYGMYWCIKKLVLYIAGVVRSFKAAK